jgi:hypothetical protein
MGGIHQELVLVWQWNVREARWHTDEHCPSLTGSDGPARSVRFEGPGTAGWLPLAEAQELPEAAPCGRCM